MQSPPKPNPKAAKTGDRFQYAQCDSPEVTSKRNRRMTLAVGTVNPVRERSAAAARKTPAACRTAVTEENSTRKLHMVTIAEVPSRTASGNVWVMGEGVN